MTRAALTARKERKEAGHFVMVQEGFGFPRPLLPLMEFMGQLPGMCLGY